MAVSEKSCCVPSCVKTRADDIVLHSFPNPDKDRERFHTWVLKIGTSVSSLDPHYVYKCRRVCHDHFETKYLTWTRRLSPNAIPTLLIPEDPPVHEPPTRPHAPEFAADTIDLPDDDGKEKQLLDTGIALDDDDSTPSPVPEQEASRDEKPYSLQKSEWTEAEQDASTREDKKLFSWQKTELIAADEDIPEDVTLALEAEEPADPGVSLYDDDPVFVSRTALRQKEVEHQCKECGETIEGFEFWCVQCAGAAACGACDARGPHRAHAVLRVPARRPHRQTQAVLAAIRHQLLNDNLFMQHDTEDGGIKFEVKEEPPEVEMRVINTPAEPDPLATASHPASPNPSTASTELTAPSPNPTAASPYPTVASPDPTAASPDPTAASSDPFSPKSDPYYTIPDPFSAESDSLDAAPDPLAARHGPHGFESYRDKREHSNDLSDQPRKRRRLQHHRPLSERNFTVPSHALKDSPVPVKVTSQPRPPALASIDSIIDLDDVEEYTEIEVIDESLLEEDELNENIRIAERGAGRCEAIETIKQLPMEGPRELMPHLLPSKSLVRLQPLSTQDIAKWASRPKRKEK